MHRKVCATLQNNKLGSSIVTGSQSTWIYLALMPLLAHGIVAENVLEALVAILLS